jgi:hypothetical protein
MSDIETFDELNKKELASIEKIIDEICVNLNISKDRCISALEKSHPYLISSYKYTKARVLTSGEILRHSQFKKHLNNDHPELFFFIVKTGYHRQMNPISDEDNERISSDATDDGYESNELDLIGFFNKGGVFSYRSQKMTEKYSRIFIQNTFELEKGGEYLVFASNYGTIDHVRNYIVEMNFCHVAEGETFVRGFKKSNKDDYILLEFGTEAG